MSFLKKKKLSLPSYTFYHPEFLFKLLMFLPPDFHLCGNIYCLSFGHQSSLTAEPREVRVREALTLAHTPFPWQLLSIGVPAVP